MEALELHLQLQEHPYLVQAVVAVVLWKVLALRLEQQVLAVAQVLLAQP
jgi:hypothetical protein